mgnify:CR=1 FL=1
MSNSNQITKALYERAASWMANVDNPEDFYEDFGGVGKSDEDVKLEAEAHLKEEAFDIMYEIYQIYSNSDGGRN